MISKENFITIITEEFQVEDETCVFHPTSRFKEEKVWSSMMALLIIVQITDVYGVVLDNNEMNSVSTIDELYDLVVKRKKEENSCPS